MSNMIGALGLDYGVAGQVVQSLGRCIVDREIEGIGEEQVRAYFESDEFNEDRLWFDLAPIVDRLEEQVSDWLARSQPLPPRYVVKVDPADEGAFVDWLNRWNAHVGDSNVQPITYVKEVSD